MVLASGLSASSDLKGNVRNLTTSASAAGDEVILLSRSDGMRELARTETDDYGHFTVNLPENTSAVVQVIHQGVTYHQSIQPGTDSVEMSVYDVSTAIIDGIGIDMDLQRYQAQDDGLNVSELILLRNSTNPPRTVLTDRPFEIYLPAEAHLQLAGVQRGSQGQASRVAPIPDEEKGHYYFRFPIYPGETYFQIKYNLSYEGEKAIKAKAAFPTSSFVVALPKTMVFEPDQPGLFETREDNPEANIHLFHGMKRGQQVSFRISGTGTLPILQKELESRRADPRRAAGEDKHLPGREVPLRNSDPPRHFLWWYILAILTLALIAVGVYVSRRSLRRRLRRPALEVPETELLRAISEELHELQLNHSRGRISTSQYLSAKGVLDRSLNRASLHPVESKRPGNPRFQHPSHRPATGKRVRGGIHRH
jgi:hypothetical protein